jgi:CHAT domain-containing protein
MEKALILANPQLVEAGSVLKFAEVEAESVGKLFPQSVLLRGAEASKSAFVKLSPGYDVLHLACHGVMDQTEPMLSNLRLAGDNENNGVLTVREIFDLNLDAGLVTLSACNTGTGEVTGSGFEFMGMTRAFLYAGTPSVLASLWCVDDRATAELMELFYKNLLAGLTKSEALQKAQLTMMKKYENPYYWGAFVLYGDYR